MAKQNQLTQKHAKFVRQYVAHGVGARAARKASYAISSARITASRLLTKANRAMVVPVHCCSRCLSITDLSIADLVPVHCCSRCLSISGPFLIF
jgi:recombinational DNA repair protein RecR